MHELSFEDQELSSADLAVLQAFDAMTVWESEQADLSASTLMPVSSSGTLAENDDEVMRAIFLNEANEEIHKMRKALERLELDDVINPARFVTMRRAGHKLRGTAAAVDCSLMSIVAQHAEVIAEQVSQGLVLALIGATALSQAVTVLELDLQNLADTGNELQDEALVPELEDFYRGLGINLMQPLSTNSGPLSAAIGSPPTTPRPATPQSEANSRDDGNTYKEWASIRVEDAISVHIPSQRLQESTPAPSFIRIDTRRFANLEQHSEQLLEQRAQLEDAQAQMELALQELHAAQNHLQESGQLLSRNFAQKYEPQVGTRQSSSSLIARILQSAPRSNSSALPDKSKVTQGPVWDELDMERYNEKDLLIHSLKEAIADVMITSTLVNAAYQRLYMLQQTYMSHVAQVRNDILSMRLMSLSALVPRLQRVVDMSPMAQEQHVQFEVTGENIEIDQELLDALSTPLLQLLRSCISDAVSMQNDLQGPYRVWLHAKDVGYEITIEIGFSMMVLGGAVNALREAIQQLNGNITLERNNTGGISFLLRLPRVHGVARCLLVRAGNQQIIVPFSQVQRIGMRDAEQFDTIYQLTRLLDFPSMHLPESRVQPVLILTAGTASTKIGISVDEVISEVEVVIRPLPAYLQRPGIAGSAVDGKGHVLLTVNLPELVRHYTLHNPARKQQGDDTDEALSASMSPERRPLKILVADDSAALRHSLLQVLEQARYIVAEASDGMEALEHMREQAPDICLLDIEMPNLNGYDLLSIMHNTPELASIKTIMLTSRTSEKHMQHARELGAQGYLTKPCPPETLLATIREVLTH